VNLVQRLSRIILICSEPGRLAVFYESAFGFARTCEVSITESAFAKLLGIAGATARSVTLQLGEQEIELLGVHPPGRPYPRPVLGQSALFQHVAIVVSNMESAYARLSSHRGWSTISTDGPQLLPLSSGGVTAYKFRDPEGHPLELIAFPSGAIPARWQKYSTAECLGIDHSAISVAATERSVEYYKGFGLKRTGGSFNIGREQDKLDDIAKASLEVTALTPPEIPTPHVELLCYRGGFDGETANPDANDIAATRLVMKVETEAALKGLCTQRPGTLLSGPVRFEQGALCANFRDPDGHLLTFETFH
jgi:catechol 2,3-dioxygenase-like lactoylglutathione lyase family enzyme